MIATLAEVMGAAEASTTSFVGLSVRLRYRNDLNLLYQMWEGFRKLKCPGCTVVEKCEAGWLGWLLI